MKQFIVTIFLSVAFSAILNAAERKIAYDRGGKIFVADVNDTPLKENCGHRLAGDFTGRHTGRFRTPVAAGLWPVPRAVCQRRKDGPQGRGYIRGS